MNPGDRDLEALLRRALADEAGRIEPAGDGLSRIRARTGVGRRAATWWARWSVPALALAGAAAVIAAVAALPSVLGGDGTGPVTPAARATSSAPPATTAPTLAPPAATAQRTPTAPPPTSPSPAPTTRSTPSAPAELPDMRTVWPYASRREGAARAEEDVRTGTRPALRDPARTAVDFVAAFIGSEGLTASRLDAYPPGLRMLVSRDGHPVSTVFLVRVRTGDDAPYVVVGAGRAAIEPQESLTLSPPPRVADTGAFVAQGTLRRAAGSPDPRVVVELREPGGTARLARAEVTVPLGDAVLTGWSATLSPSAAPDRTGVVAAWTVEPDGRVLEFVAAPTAP